MRTRLGAAALLAAVAALVGGCATKTAVSWRAEERFEPLPPDAEVRFYVRTTAPGPLREALLERGAEEVVAFPEGTRVAEIAANEAAWLSWDAVLDEVRTAARSMGADRAMATGAVSAGPGEHVLWFQLVRSFDADRD